MRIRSGLTVFAFATIVSVILIGGCPQSGNSGASGGTNTTSNTLTSGEQQSVEAGLNATASLAGATNTTQSTAGDDAQSSLDTPGLQSFGTCPEVTLTPATGEQDAKVFVASVDFGDGCYPGGEAGQDKYFVSGSAEGSFDQATQTVAMQFNSLSVNGATLDGTCDVALAWASDGLVLDGAWNLNYTAGEIAYSTNGDGTAKYDPSTQATTISTFTGSIEDGTETYAAELSNVMTSYNTYGNIIPSSGAMTLSGPEIRSLEIRFNAESPTTYVVEVSINGGEFFEWEIAH
jgi:hypothetical protein